jgi:hypothetical protein
MDQIRLFLPGIHKVYGTGGYPSGARDPVIIPQKYLDHKWEHLPVGKIIPFITAFLELTLNNRVRH